jgi:hypothetical protein
MAKLYRVKAKEDEASTYDYVIAEDAGLAFEAFLYKYSYSPGDVVSVKLVGNEPIRVEGA